MKNWIKSLVSVAAIAVAGQSAIAADYEETKSKIEKTLSLDVSAIGDSPVPGLLQLVTSKGFFYSSPDGKYLLQARVYNLDEEMRNETEIALGGMRLDGISEFQDSVIEFKAEKEKYVVNVFTDITCGYCRKLHNEMKDYNDLGITVRYLAFPRGGLRSKSYNDMVSVWCAEDKQTALTEAKNGESVPDTECTNTVANQYNFGQRIGVAGTPNIILPDGSLIGGYQPAPQLLQSLKNI